jgi:MFS family permease
MLGISISSFAYPLVVLDQPGSPAKAGLVGSILGGTAFFLRLPAGVLVDRWNRRAILIACDVGRALNAAAFAIALALGHFFYPQVLAVAFVEAALGVLFGPAEAAAVRRVVAPEQVRAAVAQNQSRSAIPGLIGPPLGGRSPTSLPACTGSGHSVSCARFSSGSSASASFSARSVWSCSCSRAIVEGRRASSASRSPSPRPAV